jgi:hypothetical protein
LNTAIGGEYLYGMRTGMSAALAELAIAKAVSAALIGRIFFKVAP